MSDTAAAPMTFEAAMKRLEEIVQRLERGELPLEESLSLYEEGIRLSRLCHTRLDEAEGRIEVILKDARGEAALDREGRLKTSPLPRDDRERP
jgi:exodeoxyribonuclease VII small subunit